MTGLMNKVKEALHSGSHSEQPEGTHGHHNSRAANAADPRIDSDRDHRAATTTTTTGAHDGSYTASDNYTYGSNNRGADGPATRTDGPHNSNLLNKADPRVDSDRDHSRNMGANPSGTATTGAHNTTGTTGTSGLHSTTSAHTGTHTGTTGLSSTGTTGTHTGTTGANRTAGPHNSDLLNKADPRVDSDRDHSRNMGMNPSGTATTGTHTGTTGLHSTTGAHTGTTGLHSTTGAPEGTHGPHSSRVANAADPRVDSDRDHRGATGTAGGKSAIGGFGTSSTTHGTHGTTGTTGTTGLTGTHAPGPAPNTAGPHKSDMMNKIDPRVDSDLDGSKTYGGDKTYTRS